jgi:hypothetical protein
LEIGNLRFESVEDALALAGSAGLSEETIERTRRD